jgi:hypothetical protein
MFSRSVQWTSVLLLVLCVALMTGGCFGGGGSDGTDQTTDTLPGGTGTLPPLGTGIAVGTLLQATEDDPADFVSALANRPIVVLFYIAGNADDTKVLDTVNKLRTSFNSYSFLLYDYKDPEAYGTLAQEFQVDYTPYLALVDSTGTLQYKYVGFVDEGTLNQSLVNLGR